MPKALIVCGGITGLATAIVLSRQGIEVDLIERQAQVRTLGSGIALIGAALRALTAFGRPSLAVVTSRLAQRAVW
jgi:2-polyprenyl-6-methoxyphenol hydroxylase-like FAD-dependent oxidoreductase